MKNQMTPKQVVENLSTMTRKEIWEYVLLYPILRAEDGDDVEWYENKYGADYNQDARTIYRAWKNAEA